MTRRIRGNFHLFLLFLSLQILVYPFLRADFTDRIFVTVLLGALLVSGVLTFIQKRRVMIDRIRNMGLLLENEPLGGFYCFASLERLPEHLRDGMNYLLVDRIITDEGIVNQTHEEYGIQPSGE